MCKTPLTFAPRAPNNYQPARIFWIHSLRNAMLPVLALLGPAIAAITTGGFVVETVFAIPGLGRYFVQAVQQLDYTVIMGTTVFYGSFLVLMVLVVDLFTALLDPRIRLQDART
jgi:ABC-type dipeptide/oligopeptide/nickel transport system permease component